MAPRVYKENAQDLSEIVLITGLALTRVTRSAPVQNLQKTATTDLFELAGSMTREIDDHGPTHHQYEKPLFQSSACGIDRAARVYGVVQYECSSRGGSAKVAHSSDRPFGPVC